MLHVDSPLDAQFTSELSPNNCVRLFFIHKTTGYVHQTRPKGNKAAFSYLFRTHLLITISVMVLGRLGAMSRMEVFLHQA